MTYENDVWRDHLRTDEGARRREGSRARHARAGFAREARLVGLPLKGSLILPIYCYERMKVSFLSKSLLAIT